MTTSLIFGLHAVQTVLTLQPERLLHLYVSDRHDQKMQQLLQLANRLSVTIEPITKSALDELCAAGNHQGIAAVCKPARIYSENDLEPLLAQLPAPAFILILDGVQDPHNLGACFRSADAAGIQMMIAPKDKAVGITPVVAKVACGATESIPFVQVTNLARALTKLKDHGIWLYGAAGEANETIYQTTLTGPIALVLGAEGSGLRRLTRDHCDALMRIPMQGVVSSLNVSVATGIILFEALRQRMS